jgi:hypothetical protein
MSNNMTAINPHIEDLKKTPSGEINSPQEKHVDNKLAVTHVDPHIEKTQQIDAESITKLHSPQLKPVEQNYIEAFINNKLVSKVFPDMMNWLNIGGNVFSFTAHALDLNDGIKNISKKVGALTTKSFMIATSVINIIERCYAKNFLSALGFFNDIIIAATVGQQDTYLARGTASGTYNMGNSLADSVGRKGGFQSVDDHVASTFKAFNKFFGNLFSKDVIKNFANHENGMWAIFGGLGSNIGALTWMFGAKPEVPTIIRDICGVMMDIEQLNPGHLKSGRKNFFWSGVSLAVGTLSDLFMRFVPEKAKDLLVPMTFIFDGLGRHLLRLDRNERELEKEKTVKPLVSKDFGLHKAQEHALGMAA